MDKEILKFVGTGAAEGIPSPFCRCPICENARIKGGREIKTRTTFRLTKEVQIDYNADAFIQAILYKNDLFTLKHILITHTHWDHLAMGELLLREMSYLPPKHMITVYLTEEAYGIVQRTDDLIVRNDEKISKMLEGIIRFQQVHFYEEFQAGEVFVTPLKGMHHGLIEKNSALYFIKLPSGRTLLYALDTGYFPEETFLWLQGHRLDFLIIEATFGDADRGLEPYGHLDIKSVNHVMDQLFGQGTIDKNTEVYLTHMNHKHTMTHEKMEKYYEKYDRPWTVKAAFDGLKIG